MENIFEERIVKGNDEAGKDNNIYDIKLNEINDYICQLFQPNEIEQIINDFGSIYDKQSLYEKYLEYCGNLIFEIYIGCKDKESYIGQYQGCIWLFYINRLSEISHNFPNLY